MKIPGLCMKCVNENLSSDLFFVEIDESIFEGKNVTCQNGHDFFLYFDTPKYAFLFQQALEAYQAGYYFETFHTLYSGFEFYKKEFVEVVLFEQLKSIETVMEYTKTMNRSEQIEGAFKVSYIHKFTEAYPSLPRNLTEIRNKVVHSGRIPDSGDCEKLGNKIFKIVVETNRKFHDEFETIKDDRNYDFAFRGILAYNFAKATAATKQKGFDLSEDNEGFQRKSFAINELSPHTYFVDSTDNLFQKLAARRQNILNIDMDS